MTFTKKIPFTKNKYFELQTEYWKDDKSNIFDFVIRLNKRCDHAGFYFEISIWKLFFAVTIYDNRHWSWDKNEWEKYE